MPSTRAVDLPDCRPLLADPGDLTLAFRPVVDLAAAAVAGYEVSARFPGTAGPAVWFRAAADAGLGAQLQALLVHRALDRLPLLPPGAFLLVGVDADTLAAGPVQEAFTARPSLGSLVVEVRPGGTGTPDDVVARVAAALRARGAAVAAGPWPRTTSAPDLLVADRATTDAFAGTGVVGEGPRVLADGIETADDLAAALRCGAALGRGWLFGPPSAAPAPLAASVTDLVGTHDARVRRTAPVLPLVRPVLHPPAEPTSATPVLEVDGDGVPLAFLLPDATSATTWRKPVTLSVPPSATTGDTLRAALLRPVGHRYDPVLCTDEDGRPLGVLRVAELLRAAAVRAPLGRPGS